MIVLGFSQGGATASRWTESTAHRIDRLILWATVFPPDLNLPQSTNKLNASKPILLLGDSDEFINEEQWKNDTDNWKNKGLAFDQIHYKGVHRIESEVLKNLVSHL